MTTSQKLDISQKLAMPKYYCYSVFIFRISDYFEKSSSIQKNPQFKEILVAFFLVYKVSLDKKNIYIIVKCPTKNLN